MRDKAPELRAEAELVRAELAAQAQLAYGVEGDEAAAAGEQDEPESSPLEEQLAEELQALRQEHTALREESQRRQDWHSRRAARQEVEVRELQQQLAAAQQQLLGGVDADTSGAAHAQRALAIRQLHAQVLEQASQLQVAHAAATGAAASASLAAARCPRCQAADAAAEQLRLELAAGAASTAPAPLADTEPRLAKLTAAHAAAHEELQQIRTSLACEMAVAADLARHNGALKHANESLTTELAQLTEQLTRERSNGTAAKATAGQADTGKALAVGSQPASWDQLKLQVAQEALARTKRQLAQEQQLREAAQQAAIAEALCRKQLAAVLERCSHHLQQRQQAAVNRQVVLGGMNGQGQGSNTSSDGRGDSSSHQRPGVSGASDEACQHGDSRAAQLCHSQALAAQAAVMDWLLQHACRARPPAHQQPDSSAASMCRPAGSVQGGAPAGHRKEQRAVAAAGPRNAERRAVFSTCDMEQDFLLII